MITSDGRAFVYAVFGADGCECDSLEAVFEDEQSARSYLVDRIADADIYGEPKFASIEVLEIGQKRDVLAKSLVTGKELIDSLYG